VFLTAPTWKAYLPAMLCQRLGTAREEKDRFILQYHRQQHRRLHRAKARGTMRRVEIVIVMFCDSGRRLQQARAQRFEVPSRPLHLENHTCRDAAIFCGFLPYIKADVGVAPS